MSSRRVKRLLAATPESFTAVVAKRRLTALSVEPGHMDGEVLLLGIVSLMDTAGVRALRPEDLLDLAEMLHARDLAAGDPR